MKRFFMSYIKNNKKNINGMFKIKKNEYLCIEDVK